MMQLLDKTKCVVCAVVEYTKAAGNVCRTYNAICDKCAKDTAVQKEMFGHEAPTNGQEEKPQSVPARKPGKG